MLKISVTKVQIHLGHIAEHMNGLNMPNMGKLGLSNIRQIKGIEKAERPSSLLYKNEEASTGKIQ